MAIQYSIYGNGGVPGAPIDTDTPIAVVSGTSYTMSVAPGERWAFIVRASDTVTGLEELNVDSLTHFAVDEDGLDVTGIPNAPSHLSARAKAAGTALVTWDYNPGGEGAPPQGFRVFIGTPTVSFTVPVATVLYHADLDHYAATLSGLADGSVYQISVRSYNLNGEEKNSAIATVTGDVDGPAAVENLAATVV